MLQLFGDEWNGTAVIEAPTGHRPAVSSLLFTDHKTGRAKINKEGRPSHTDHTDFIAGLRLILDVEVQAGNQSASKYSAPGLWELLARLPRAHWPLCIRGDRDSGTQANMVRAEQAEIPFLFKLRLTSGVKKVVTRLMRDADIGCNSSMTSPSPS